MVAKTSYGRGTVQLAQQTSSPRPNRPLENGHGAGVRIAKRGRRGMTAQRLLSFAVCVLLLVMPGHADSLFRCRAVDSEAVTEGGQLSADDGIAQFGLFQWAEFIIDTESGLLRRGESEPVRWTVIQEGGAGDDTVLTQIFPGGRAQGTTDILRVRNWTGLPPVFVAFGTSSITTGPCEAIR